MFRPPFRLLLRAGSRCRPSVLIVFPMLAGACKPDPAADGPVSVSGFTVSPSETIGSVLVAEWSQTGAGSVWLEYSFEEDDWWTSPPVDRDAGAQRELVLGVPFGTEVSVRLAWSDEAGEGQSELVLGATDELPEGVPIVDSVEGDAAAWDPEVSWVLTSVGELQDGVERTWTLIVDRKGRLVWARPTPVGFTSLQPQPSYDGSHVLIDHNSFWAIFDDGAAAEVLRVGISGEELEAIATPEAHHPFTELNDGTIVYGRLGLAWMDSIAAVAPDGETSTLFKCTAEHVGRGDGYCASNTITWVEENDSFLFSIYSTDTVLHVDRLSGELIAAYGHIDDAWAFDPPESAWWWQHGPVLTPDGNLLISTKIEEDGDETVVREFAFDTANQTLTEVWSFGEGEGVYAETMGEADVTPGGHILHNYGSSPRLREVTADGRVVWDLWWDAEFVGRSTPLSDLYAFDR